VVEVRVREDERAQVGHAPAELTERVVQKWPGGLRNAGVDDCDRPVVLDEVPVRVRVLDAVDARRDVSREHLASGAPDGFRARAADGVEQEPEREFDEGLGRGDT
jgi:hypothetical protein